MHSLNEVSPLRLVMPPTRIIDSLTKTSSTRHERQPFKMLVGGGGGVQETLTTIEAVAVAVAQGC